MARVPNYRGPWVLRRSTSALEVQNKLESGFKYPDLRGCRKFHDLEGPLYGFRDPKEEWSQAVLLKYIEAPERFPPMLFGLVLIMIPPSPGGYFACTNQPSQRRRK